MNTFAPEFRALIIIFRSTGPVISTRRSSRPGASGATRHDGSSRTERVDSANNGNSPPSICAWRSIRAASNSSRRRPNSRCSDATNPSASSVSTSARPPATAPRTSIPSCIRPSPLGDVEARFSQHHGARRRLFYPRVLSYRGGSMALSFGVTVLPDPPVERFLELIELAEQQGFEYGWTYDSHVLWQEASPFLTMGILRTTKMKFGHFVTNPGTREPTVLASLYATLHDISGGRMVMGIGRGDSARRVVGLKPVRVAEF